MTLLFIATLVSTALLALVLGYLYATEGSAYLRHWTAHWALSAVALGVALVLGSGTPALGISLHLVSLASAVFLFMGALALCGMPRPRGWWIPIALVALWVVTRGWRDVGFTVENLPVYWLRAGLTVWAGIILMRLPRTFGAERFVPGVAFVVDGLHLADYPFLGQVEAVLPYALLLSLSNRFLIGIGMLLLYFRQARSAMERSEQRFRTAFELSPDAMTIGMPDDGEVTAANRGMEKILGYQPGELLGQSPLDLGIWVDLEQRREMMRRIRREGRVSDFRAEMRHRSGEHRQIELTGQIVSIGGEERVIIIGRDVTDRVTAEERLQRLVDILESTPDLVVFWDRAGTAQYVNAAGRTFLGIGQHERPDAVGIGRVLDPSVARAALRGALRTGSWTGETVLRDHTGTPRHASVVLIAHRDGSGRVSQLSALARDMTVIRDLQTQFLQSQKLEALGRLAGGVAHDFNNLLTVIGGHAEALEDASADDVGDSAREIRHAGERAAGLTRQLLAFARKQTASPRPVRLDDVVRNVERLVRRLIGEDVRLDVETASDATVLIDPGHLEQAVVNLVVNARDAMPEGGSIRLVTRRRRELGDAQGPFGTLDPGSYASLVVSDDGVGMDDETRARAFEPFFTTKAAGHGTGLGLSTVYGIVEQAAGAIRVESGQGQGTTVEVVLPVAQEKAGEVAGPGDAATRSGAGVRVLVVEDEDSVRSLVVRHLRTMGFEVMEAAGGAEALGTISETEEAIDVLVTDVVMPEVGGAAVAEHFHHLYPAGAVVFMSGYTDQRIGPEQLDRVGVEFLHKPFTRSTLATAIEEARAQIRERDPGHGPTGADGRQRSGIARP